MRRLSVVVILIALVAGVVFALRQPTAVDASVAGCPLFPVDNVWNTPISALPRDVRSADYVRSIGADAPLKADFGSGSWEGGPIGIPFVVVDGDQPRVTLAFDYEDESDPGPYPIPPDAPIEGGPDGDGDRHILVVDSDSCTLYEVYAAYPQTDGSWSAGSGARFDLRSNDLRPRGWTSADAAGLPILPGLVRYDEVAAGEIRHAIRFTAPRTQDAFVWPARHAASDDADSALPPMGQRFRLRADFDASGMDHDAQVIIEALKTYGMILADNGSSWFMSGVPDERWDNDVLRQLAAIKGADIEAIDATSLVVDEDSAQARQARGDINVWLPGLWK